MLTYNQVILPRRGVNLLAAARVGKGRSRFPRATRKALCVPVERVADNLEGFTYRDKRLALEALRVSAMAQPDGSIDLRLALPITLAQPLSCRSGHG